MSRQPGCAPGCVIALRLVQRMHSRRSGRRPGIDSMTIALRSRRDQRLRVLGHADERTWELSAHAAAPTPGLRTATYGSYLVLVKAFDNKRFLWSIRRAPFDECALWL
jgi:hypothetical protein